MALRKGRARGIRAAGSIAAGVALTVSLGGSTLAQEPEVIRTIQGVTHQGPWYVYDHDACTFVETADHPETYVAELKAMDGTTLVYAPEGQTAEFDVTLNAGVEAAATEAGMAYFQFSNEFPDTTLPIQVADQAVTVEADVVISGNVLADLYP